MPPARANMMVPVRPVIPGVAGAVPEATGVADAVLVADGGAGESDGVGPADGMSVATAFVVAGAVGAGLTPGVVAAKGLGVWAAGAAHPGPAMTIAIAADISKREELTIDHVAPRLSHAASELDRASMQARAGTGQRARRAR